MAFSRTVEYRDCVGGHTWISGGSWNGNDGGAVATGELDCQMKYVYSLQLTYKGNGVKTNAASVDETLPGAGDALPGVLTVDFDNGESGTWSAVGRV